MNKIIRLLVLGKMMGIAQLSLGITPQIDGDVVLQGRSLKRGVSCARNGCIVEENSCDRSKVDIYPNDDGTIDLFFTGLQASSKGGNQETNCDITIPIKIPEGMRLNFKTFELEGTTRVGRLGQSSVKLGHKMGLRSSPWVERSFRYQAMTQDVLIESSYPGEFTSCGDRRVNLLGQIRLRATGSETSINIDGGAVGARYILDYRSCSPEMSAEPRQWKRPARLVINPPELGMRCSSDQDWLSYQGAFDRVNWALGCGHIVESTRRLFSHYLDDQTWDWVPFPRGTYGYPSFSSDIGSGNSYPNWVPNLGSCQMPTNVIWTTICRSRKEPRNLDAPPDEVR